MENQVDPDAEMHHQSSSSSSSPPSSPSSSSSSSSSSPSHPQSFASSGSSQKELSAPSSSGASSTSSSPFSGPSSPAHATIDQASTSANALSMGGLTDDTLHHSNGIVTFPNSSAAEDFSDDLTLDFPGRANSFGAESHAIEGVNKYCSSSNGEERAGLNTELANFVENEVLAASTASEDHEERGNNSGALVIEQRNENVGSQSTAQVGEVDECNGCTLASDGMQLAILAASASANGENCVHAADISIEHGRTLTDDAILQREHDHATNGLEIVLDITKSMDTASSYQAATGLTGQKLTQSPHHLKPNSEVDTSLMSDSEPEGAHNFPDPSKCKDSPSSSAEVRDEIPLENNVGEKERLFSPNATKVLETSSEVFKEVSSDIGGLQRAKTMPSGSLEYIDGEVQPSRRRTFQRSSTDKSKADKDNPVRTPTANKISKRKQKKLMKRMCTMQKDGTVELDIERSAPFPSNLFGPDVLEDLSSVGEEGGGEATPPLQIAMLIVGTRGDVQPFVAIGKRLQEHGHRVRLATHSNFEDFVLKAGLEFYPLGGDPKVLAEYMVKNKGFLPSGPSEIRTQKKQLKSIINSLLPACTCSYGTDVAFKVQAIIANPPAYGHVHVAEFLKVPLHIFFTMPWTPTSEFAHPLSRVGHFAANRLSYQVVDSLIWVGIRGMINDFRKKKLKLRPITYLSGSQLSVSKLPTGYIWSPQLVPKPKDWGSKVDVVGFCFLNLCQDYNPPDQLVKWLAAGPSPVYVGFGSLPVEDPERMTEIILDALKRTSQRGIINKGWGGIGTMVDLPDSVYLLDNCPHDWLFSQCAAVVHHGGAGTTAAGLKAACPTTIIPFFGDQAFWGDRVHSRGVGPAPIPVDQFSVDKLVHAIKFMMDNEVKQRAVDLAEAMKEEDGVEGAVQAFHKHLPRNMSQSVPSFPARSGCGGSVIRRIRLCFGHT